VIGASGGIGAALAAQLERRGDAVVRAARSVPADAAIDITDEGSVAAAAAQLAGRAPFDLVLVATGLLHDAAHGPERALRDLDGPAMLRAFAVNAVGPALIAKHFVPLLAPDRPAVFACLSARVGSISDNRLGGWYAYRASKAALNMIVRCLAIELRRARPQAIAVGLHPGTVDTRLSAPFRRGLAPDQLVSPDTAAANLLRVIDGLKPEDSGGCFAWDGAPIPA
jgi:NAD(P)-dependent dehydrogenase (short-subunit alcohol dehydrogenase family)